jgi:predicted RNase H-related nuclease YkuK (DUF458 family)
MHWRTFKGDPIQEDIIQKVEQTIVSEISNGYKLKVCIGTDSCVHGSMIEFATVIVFLREKRGGFMYINSSKVQASMTIRERMIQEVARSVDVAFSLCKTLDRYQVELEVHADINTDPDFQSNSALKDAMGYILGMGFVFKAKPDAFASSSCADKMV